MTLGGQWNDSIKEKKEKTQILYVVYSYLCLRSYRIIQSFTYANKLFNNPFKSS